MKNNEQLEIFGNGIGQMSEKLEDLVKVIRELTEAVNCLYSDDMVEAVTELNETLKDYCSLVREQREWKLASKLDEYG